MKKTLLIVVLFLSLGCFAQGEANIWYFGYHAGLDFNSGNPVVLTDGQLNTQEGCSTISNATGQLLFYTNGVSVWNKNHQIMPNGSNLFGDSSSTQSAIIIPKPNDPNIYYIFTVAELAKPDGLKFSEVDLSLSGGLGDVNSNKNISLITPVCEKLTAVKNANGDGYWIVVHSYGNNSFLAYSITSAGINLTPIRSNLGAVIDTTGLNAIGYLKFSPDGTRLISCSPGNVEIFDFDNATGIISNKKLIWQEYDEYGAEFSPSGKIVYITSKFQKLIQFDLTSTNIPNSAIIIYDWNQNDPHHLGALQLAKNGKIYGCVWREQYVSIINNPDVLGIGCNFTLLGIQLNTGTCYSGLPQFIQSYFIIEINAQNNCMGETTTFSLSGNQTFTSAIWDFGDGFTSTAINPTHLYTSVGTYTVSVTTSGPNGTSTKKRDVIISKVPTATQPQNLLICDDNNDGQYLFDLTKQNAVILNGQDPNSYTVNYFANGTDYANNLTIATPSAYVNKNAYQAETIIAEVSNNANSTCKSATNFTIDVFDIPKPNLSVTRLASCDNTSAGTDTDGRVVFDLTQRATSILNGQAATQFLLSYYKDSALTQVIATPKVYQNTNATETIYVKMENMDNANCFATTSFKIEVLALPLITNVVDLKQCDDNIDGFSVFNLEEAISKITINSATETITFHKTLADAQNNTNIITNTTTYTNQTVSIDKVYVRVTNSNDCFRIAQLNLIVSTTQIPATFFKTFTQCDDAILGTNTDGIASFDFSEVTQNIQDIFPSGQLLDITYYQNVADALAEKNSIADISNYRNTSSPKGQSIYIRVDSKLNNDCLGLGGYITIKVNPFLLYNQ
ncbi:MAG: PKD domain-containing protein [bacterium]|nr:PKD domain-containing protein [bacterium]